MRVHNWDVLATQWAIEQVGKPFVWGETDCGSLFRGMYEVMYQQPLSRHYYRSLRGALAVLETTGGVRQVLLDLGAEQLRLPYASTGDVLVDIQREGEPFEATLCVITDKALFTEPDAVVRLIPLTTIPDTVTLYRIPPNG